MTRVFLSLGSNVQPEKNLRLALHELRSRYGQLILSPVYRNKAVGFVGDDFLNLVAGCEVDVPLEQVIGDVEDIHVLAGRRRGKARYSARSLDIDILLFGAQVSSGPPLALPRADVLKYGFVLKPLTDIAADTVHPQTGRTFADHWQEMGARLSDDGHELHRVEFRD